MPDTTPNYGWRIPKSDGTDYIVPDDVRLPITSIDAALKTTDNNIAGNATLIGKLPKGIVANGYAEIVLPTASVSAITIMAGLQLSNITLVAGRNYELEAFLNVAQSVITDKIAMYLFQNGAQIQGAFCPQPNGVSTSTPFVMKKMIFNAGAASGQTFDVRLGRSGGTGVAQCVASTIAPNYIVLKDLGAP